MNFFIWLLVGGFSGWVAGKIMQGSGYGPIRNIILGVIGAELGGLLGQFLGLKWAGADGFNLASIITSVVGAVLLIFLWRVVKGER